MAGFETILNLSVAHDFYKDLNSKDFKFFISTESLKQLKAHRILYRNRDNGFTLIAETHQPGTPTITIDQEIDLFFGFQLTQAEQFYGSTQLGQTAPDLDFESHCRQLYQNDGLTEQLEYRVLHQVSQQNHIFRYAFQKANPGDPDLTSVEISVLDKDNNPVVADFDSLGAEVNGPYTIESTSDRPNYFEKQFNFKNAGNGFYSLIIRKTSDNLLVDTKQVFIHHELGKSSIAGIVHLNLPVPTLPLVARTHEIVLQRIESFWEYHVINKSNIDLDENDLVLQDESLDDGTDVFDTYSFSGNPNGIAQPNPDPNNSVSGFDTLVFKSTAKIPFYEEPKKKLQLKKIDEDEDIDSAGKVLYLNLPNPKPANRTNDTSKIYVYV